MTRKQCWVVSGCHKNSLLRWKTRIVGSSSRFHVALENSTQCTTGPGCHYQLHRVKKTWIAREVSFCHQFHSHPEEKKMKGNFEDSQEAECFSRSCWWNWGIYLQSRHLVSYLIGVCYLCLHWFWKHKTPGFRKRSHDTSANRILRSSFFRSRKSAIRSFPWYCQRA